MTDDPPCEPNWRDDPEALDRLYEIGARAFHDPHFGRRKVDTVTISEEYL